jgi:hypothetical protein
MEPAFASSALAKPGRRRTAIIAKAANTLNMPISVLRITYLP